MEWKRKSARGMRSSERAATTTDPPVRDFTRLADWRIVGNAEGNVDDLLKTQDYVWEHSGRRGPRPSSIRARDARTRS